LAICDINVAGFNISPIAEIVAARSLPFIFVSGYGPEGRPVLFSGTPVLRKPFLIEDFAAMINAAMATKGTTSPSQAIALHLAAVGAGRIVAGNKLF
jgi:hypothetical protein